METEILGKIVWFAFGILAGLVIGYGIFKFTNNCDDKIARFYKSLKDKENAVPTTVGVGVRPLTSNPKAANEIGHAYGTKALKSMENKNMAMGVRAFKPLSKLKSTPYVGTGHKNISIGECLKDSINKTIKKPTP